MNTYSSSTLYPVLIFILWNINGLEEIIRKWNITVTDVLSVNFIALPDCLRYKHFCPPLGLNAMQKITRKTKKIEKYEKETMWRKKNGESRWLKSASNAAERTFCALNDNCIFVARETSMGFNFLLVFDNF